MKTNFLKHYPEFEHKSDTELNSVIQLEIKEEDEHRVTAITTFEQNIYVFRVCDKKIVEKFEYSEIESIPTCVLVDFDSLFVGTSSEGLFHINMNKEILPN